MASRNDTVPEPSQTDGVSRRRFLTAASTGVAGAGVVGSALADTLADVPARGPGAPLGGHSERRLHRISPKDTARGGVPESNMSRPECAKPACELFGAAPATRGAAAWSVAGSSRAVRCKSTLGLISVLVPGEGSSGTAQVIALWAFRPLCAERLAPASKPQLELPRACHAAGGKYLIFRVPFGVFRHSMSLFSVDSSGLAKVGVASSSRFPLQIQAVTKLRTVRLQSWLALGKQRRAIGIVWVGLIG
jgi:hypothetical protein